MGIICNGIQRSGTHLLAKCVENCGYERIEGVLRARDFDTKDPEAGPRKIDSREFLTSFGEKNCVIGHATYPAATGDNKIIFITRHPLNWVVSVARYKSEGRPAKPSLEMLAHIIEDKLHLLFGYIGWIYKADLVVRFEDLVAHKTLPICEINGVAHGDDIHKIGCHINKESQTYTGRLSNHTEVFDASLYKLFELNHGLELSRLLGYE